MHFRSTRRSGDVVIEAERLSKAYAAPLFTDLSFQLKRGQRLGIVGANGSGKTTLLRILLGDEKPDSGTVRRGHLVDVGYYDQQLQSLDDNEEVLRAGWPAHDPDWTEQHMRDLLARYGISGPQIEQRVGSLSGGERSRVALVRLVAREVNVLILDEPTNHLDIWARESLEEALKEFDGTVIVVSHDRYFLNRVVDMMVVLGDGKGLVVYGNYETFERLHPDWGQETEDRGQRSGARDQKTEDREQRTEDKGQKAKRKRRFPYRKAEELEAEIHALEDQKNELEQLLASPELYRDGDKVKQTTQAFEEAKGKLARLYEHWEEAVELNRG
jgi:ATP-binding cassette subfamily F protein 3